MLSELVPRAKVIALLVNPNNALCRERHNKTREEAALTKGVQLHVLKASNESEIDAAFATLAQTHADALIHSQRPVVQQPESTSSWRWHRASRFRLSMNGVNTRRPGA